ncbi:hypothetical protein ACFLZY_02235 [Patescibacteria group bacterium]
MFSMYSKFQSITLTILFLGFFVLNLAWQNSILGIVLFLLYIAFFGLLTGQAVSPRDNPILQWWLGTWILLSAIIVIGSLAYYIAVFSPEVVYTITLLTPPVIWFLTKFLKRSTWFDHQHDLISDKKHRIPAAVWLAGAIILFSLFLIINSIEPAITTQAARSLWGLVDNSIFLASFIVFFLLTALLYRGQEKILTLSLTTLTLFLFISLAVLIFPLGYGFDSFIHQATEKHIAEFGSISPKPFYYIGQYVLVLFGHFSFEFPVVLLDKWLLPGLTALLLPLAWYSAAAHLFSKKRIAIATLIGIFLLPLSSFIVTTPQGLANLWILLLVLASVPYLTQAEKPRPVILFLPALATILIHPIAGIPILLYLFLLLVEPKRFKTKLKIIGRIVFWFIAALGSIILPLSFLANSILAKTDLVIDLQALTLKTIIGSLPVSLFWQNNFHPLLDLVYLYGLNAMAVIFIVAWLGWWAHRKNQGYSLRLLLILVLILIINFVVLSTAIDFSFLIDYERLNYANRLIPLMAYFLAPLFILGLGTLFEKITTSPIILKVFSLILLAILATSALYLTYPRDDAFVRGHGFNVSQSDINAVFATEQAANTSDYIVLANQSVSAAAISQLGFTRYYGEQFFYPIPTGGELYQSFLKMNEKPNQETAIEAMDLINKKCHQSDGCLADVQTVFYLVNDYWWQAPRLIEAAKQTATTWLSIDQGKIYIFRYDR